MPKTIISLLSSFLLLVACTALAIHLSPTDSVSPNAIKSTLLTTTPRPAVTGTLLPAIGTITAIPTNKPGNVEDLIQVLYASDPDWPQYDPQSLPYAQFPDALEQLSAMGPKAIDAASHIAHAISFPRQEAILAAETLIALGPDITATTIPILMDNLHNQKSQSRLFSVIILGTVMDKASCAVGDIGPLLWDADPEVRFASAFALEKITGKDLLPNDINVYPDPLSANTILTDTPDGKFVKNARSWWTVEGSKVDWHHAYGICDP